MLKMADWFGRPSVLPPLFRNQLNCLLFKAESNTIQASFVFLVRGMERSFKHNFPLAICLS